MQAEGHKKPTHGFPWWVIGWGGLGKNDDVCNAGTSGKRLAIMFRVTFHAWDESRRFVLAWIGKDVSVSDQAEGFDSRQLFGFLGSVFLIHRCGDLCCGHVRKLPLS